MTSCGRNWPHYRQNGIELKAYDTRYSFLLRRDAALQQVDGKESTIGQREKEFSEISNHNQELIRTNNDLTERMCDIPKVMCEA